MRPNKEFYEALILMYECQSCHMMSSFSFVTTHQETITKEQALIDVLESTPCRHCRFEKLKYREKRLVHRAREI